VRCRAERAEELGVQNGHSRQAQPSSVQSQPPTRGVTPLGNRQQEQGCCGNQGPTGAAATGHSALLAP
jgi:hypothetical protein